MNPNKYINSVYYEDNYFKAYFYLYELAKTNINGSMYFYYSKIDLKYNNISILTDRCHNDYLIPLYYEPGFSDVDDYKYLGNASSLDEAIDICKKFNNNLIFK